MNGIRCTACGSPSEPGAKFCDQCGTPLSKACTACQHPLKPDAMFCAKCGAPVDSPSRKPTVTRSDAERRQLTVMFCDLVGSVSLAERLDGEELRELISGYHEACTDVIHNFDGHIAQYLGDGLLVYFGYPAAREDDAVRAVSAGLEIIAAMGSSSRIRHRVALRVGIDTGQVVVGEIGGGGRREELALGSTPNVAARIQAHAEPNTLLIGGGTYSIVKGFFECAPLGRVPLKGLSTMMELYKVTGLSTARRRYDIEAKHGLAPMVGRSAEVRLLEDLWQRSREGRGQVVLIGGEAGIGKTRLVEALKHRVKQEQATCNELRCSPEYRTAAFYPVIDFLQRLMRFHECQSPEEKFARLEASMSRYAFYEPEVLTLMAALLSLPPPSGSPSPSASPAVQRQRMLEALVSWICEEAQRQPVLSIWEDLHWADPSTLELLGMLTNRLVDIPTLALLTFRLPFETKLAEAAHVTPVHLQRLSNDQVEAMLRGLVKDRYLPPVAVSHVVAKTDGVPLFVEELTKMLVETGALQETANGFQVTRELVDTNVPSTLQDSLMARLDLLGRAKTVAQLGATIGREFSYGVIRAVSGYPDTVLEGALHALRDAELLREYGPPPNSRYVFRHALIRDTAYNSLLRSRRRQVHLKVAETFEKLDDVSQNQPELLAYHFTEADALERAIEYWQRAGERAVRRSANAEAIHHLQAGLALLAQLAPSAARDSKELSLQLGLGAPLIAVQGFASTEVQATFTRARELCHVLQATADLFPVLFRLRSFHLVKGDVETAYELGKELTERATRTGDPDFLIEAHYALGAALFYAGEFAEALTVFHRMESYYDPGRHSSHAYVYGQEPGMACLAYQAWLLAYTGYPSEGAEKMRAALDIAEASKHPFSLAFAWTFATMFHSACSQPESTQKCAEEAIALSTKYGFPFWRAMATNFLGWALVQRGQAPRGIENLVQGIGGIRVTGSELGMTHYLRLLSEAYAAVGNYADALRHIDDAIAMSTRHADRDFDASNAYRVKAELLLAGPGRASDVQAAEQLLQRALEIARRQGARPMALQATTCLARVWHERGDTKAAFDLLSEELESLSSDPPAPAFPAALAARSTWEELRRALAV
jgi:class 3 adenylate cyclase/tetratricopeptide (TPR) repeat protein